MEDMQDHEVLDFAIIGGGYSGLMAALRLSQQGLKGKVFEKQREPGGRFVQEERDGFTLNQFPSSITAELGMESIQSESHLEVDWDTLDQEAVYFEDHKFKPLDQTKRKLLPHESLYTMKKRFLPKQGYRPLADRLANQEGVDFEGSAHVVKIKPTSKKGEEFEITLSNHETYVSKAVLWTASLSSLQDALQQEGLEEAIPATFFTRIRSIKPKPFLKLDFALKRPLYDGNEVIVIPFSRKNPEEGHLFGEFPSNLHPELAPEGKQLSSWWCVFPDTDEDNPHREVMKRIRHCKRLIKKAFPKFFEAVLWDRISFSNESTGAPVDNLEKNLIPFKLQPIKGFHLSGEHIGVKKLKKEEFLELDPISRSILSAVEKADLLKKELH
jgi:phytoene dehydrogenase-like protein